MLTTVIGAEAGTTTLNTTEASDPWRREYRLGIGVDAVTGQLRASGVKAFTVSDTSPLAATYSYSLVQNESDLSTMISGSAKGSYNIEGVTVTAGTSFLNSVKVNELSVTLVAQLHVQRTQHSLAPSYQLAAPASPTTATSTATTSWPATGPPRRCTRCTSARSARWTIGRSSPRRSPPRCRR